MLAFIILKAKQNGIQFPPVNWLPRDIHIKFPWPLLAYANVVLQVLP